MPQQRSVRIVCVVALVQILAGAEEVASRRRDVTELSLEDLANQLVTTVGKKRQPLSRTAAAVFVLTHEDIARLGFTSIPEVLRTVPGLQVARIDSSKWAISSRGFNGLFSNKLLVLVDGRSVYSPLFSGVYWSLQDMILEDIERIEVIRGPGAALWGANAVNGVINIIMKHAKDTQGGLVAAHTGTEDRRIGSLRFGTRLGGSAYGRFYGKHLLRDHLLSEPGAAAPDRWNAQRGGFRIDWELGARDSITVQGDFYDATAGQRVLVPSFQSPFVSITNDRAYSDGANILTRWTTKRSDTSEISLQFYYDRFRRYDQLIGHTQDMFDFDLQHRFQPARRHDVIWGLGYRLSSDGLQPTPVAAFRPPGRNMQLFSAFVSDEIALADTLSLMVGAKVERNDFTKNEFQPNVRLLWSPTKRHAMWSAVSRAVRLPNRTERDILLNYGVVPSTQGLPVRIVLAGTDDNRSEVLLAYELGYRVQPADWLAIDVAGFLNKYRRLLSFAPGEPQLQLQATPPNILQPLYFANNDSLQSRGVEITSTITVRPGLRVSGSYTELWLKPENTASRLLPQRNGADNPNHQLNTRFQWNVTKSVEFDSALYYVSALPAVQVPAYARLDSRIGWRPTPHLELSLVGQNLAGGRHREFVPEALIRESAVGRSAYIRVAWRFLDPSAR